MQLNSLLQHISYKSLQGNGELSISGISYHSRTAAEGSLFVCIRGQKTDGHDYVQQVLEQGAAAVVVEERALFSVGGKTKLYTKQGSISLEDIIHSCGAAVVVVQEGRIALAELSAAFFDFPAKKLKMIGITGTKGKTTTAFLTAGILREAGYRTGMIGTIFIDNGKETVPAEHTTPESYDLQRYLAEMVENGCDCCVMEVSSQGIKLNRTFGIWFDIGVFLNIEPDHIGAGEHATFLEYLYCKSRLLQQCTLGIVNRDEPKLSKILRGHTCRIEGFSKRGEAAGSVLAAAERTDFYMVKGKLYSCVRVRLKGERFTFQMQLPGMFNVSNALAAIAVTSHFDVTTEQMERALVKQVVPGRCENVGISEKYVFLIDYAHNEMSLRNLLETLRDFNPGRLVVIFGCGGNRSKLRRNRMGETAGHLADFTILTSDNPRWEKPEDILDDIEEGIRGTGGAYVRIADRAEAAAYAVEQARQGDIIVLAGKGHEGYQEICGVKYPMSERELIENAVRSRNPDGNKKSIDEVQRKKERTLQNADEAEDTAHQGNAEK